MRPSTLYVILVAVFQGSVLLNAGYVRQPDIAHHPDAVLKGTLDLVCNYTGPERDGRFVDWRKDNVSVTKDKAGHYKVHHSEKASVLSIRIFVQADADVSIWQVVTNQMGQEKLGECEFGRILLKPSPQSIETNRAKEKLDASHGSIRRIEDEALSLTCNIKPEQDTPRNSIPLEWTYSANDDQYEPIAQDGITVVGRELNIAHVKKAHRGYYRCTLNDVSFNVLLRVKDRLAALWPFLGIVGIVLVLVILILIFERRQKSAKKVLTVDDDEQDQVDDPLVRSSTRASDNESKKRAVKA